MKKRIGEFLVEKGVLVERQVQEILKYSQANGMRFGEAGLELGYLTREKLVEVFGPNFKVDFFHIDPQYYPETTRDLLTPDEIVRLGALPLGYKTENSLLRRRRLLNVGFLDPGRPGIVEEILVLARAKLGEGEIHAIKSYLILTDQFLDVLRGTYGLEENYFRNREQGSIDPTLAMFVGA